MAGQPRAKHERLNTLGYRVYVHLPNAEGDILPTRFGNAIRSFEIDPREIYGVDTIPVWQRLVSVIPKDFVAQIENARTTVDFFVNMTFLTGWVAMAAMIAAAVGIDWAKVDSHTLTVTAVWPYLSATTPGTRLVIAVVGSVLSFGFYRWATSSVYYWGDLVKSAFDCYLPALIRQLGYAVPQRFWDEFSALMLYQQPMIGPWPTVKDPTNTNGPIR